MLKQIYTPKELAKIISKENVWKRNLWENNDSRMIFLNHHSDIINKPDFTLSPFSCTLKNKKNTYQLSNDTDWLAVKKTDYFIKRIYKVTHCNRNIIIKQIKALLKDQCNLKLIRLDILSFYESISFEVILEKIKQDMILSYKGIKILESLLKQTRELAEYKTNGIPRGIGISATLSEIIMKKIDRDIRNLSNVFYYIRYVDDIIIIADNRFDDILCKITSILDNFKLTINTTCSKKKELPFNDYKKGDFFDYLGYEFSVKKNNKNNQVDVKISKDKMKRIKIKITKSFYSYLKDNNFKSLIERLRFLSTNIVLSKSKNGNLYGGNSFSYSEITDPNQLKEIDNYVYSILKGNGRIGKKLVGKISPLQIMQIKRFNFFNAFNKKLLSNFSKIKSEEIIKAFGYV